VAHRFLGSGGRGWTVEEPMRTREGAAVGWAVGGVPSRGRERGVAQSRNRGAAQPRNRGGGKEWWRAGWLAD
jgi:hypothetical protein